MKRLTDLYARFLSLFPEREFHCRVQGRVHYFRLSQRAQVGTFAIVCVALAWSAFATFYFVTMDRVLRDKEIEIAQAKARLSDARDVFMPPNSSAQPAIAWNRDLGKPDAARAQRARHTPGSKADPRVDRVPNAQAAITANPAIGGLGNALAKLEQAKTTAEKERDSLKQRLDRMNSSLGAKDEIMKLIDQKTARRIEEIEKVIAMTGLDPDSLVKSLNDNGKGGPADTVVAASTADEAFVALAARLQNRLDRWEKMQAVLKRMPLIAPLDHYRKSSDYGSRTDPVTGKISGHHGTDFAYHMNTPVLATAPGTVVFAGWRGGYGWFVEIDHGMGIRTRYAHLKKILVTKDQKVGFRDKIGLLGTSGRSTGPHVHYEVVFEGRPKDPMKFITAGKYVFKG